MTRLLYALSGADRTRQFSPHVWKTVMSLAHKGLAYETVPVGFTEIPAIEGGSTATVPLLRDGDRLVRDSFDIALYLDEAYPDRPSLFGGEGGKAMARFIESWSQSILHMAVTRIAILDIHNLLEPADQTYFRRSREERLGASLEEIAAAGKAEVEGFSRKLQPLRNMLKIQPFIGGEGPLFPDYIVFGALQWLRTTAGTKVLEEGDPVADWFARCLDLHGGVGHRVTAA
ncbi:beta-aryl ether-cleaving protein [Shinella sp. SUS2]|jgi:glutathione S-transferase|uniref:glutathione S-transferase family protein n=2 Tax=Shinella TaxID=323620 RepID=UPI0003C52EF3|nr:MULTISPECIES: glutathione S-transferase family protein [unclassified Shinella]MCA0340215.1 glutathione S-transferase family protein [Pseudomonadota bacterium]EYR78789.1 beta-etherase LigE [Shinella sp. DD12]KNY18165.1 beta-aryl ether-cleaving protein [Shinella sp. SUS2]KOC77360.1 beta-aryl ether-cleaving protein [Shinella sp. GWS1]MDG4671530.1 glutathione S-transferase family protein [Shinella sp. 838]